MPTKRYLAAATSWLVLVSAGAVAARAAEAPSVDEIVKRTNYVAYYQGKDGRARVKMAITDAQGRERNREFTILRRDDQPGDVKDADFTGEQKFYVYFRRPADVNRMVFMVHKHLDRDDDRWLYLPALDLTKRIAATDKRTSFVGSDFFYEDVSGRSTDLDTHELVQTTDTFYVLKNTPKEPDEVEFSHFTMWIHRQTFIPVQVDYFDKQGTKYRQAKALKVETIQGYPTVVKSVMKDLREGGQTLLEYSDVTYDIGLPESIFTERYLRSPPRQYLK